MLALPALAIRCLRPSILLPPPGGHVTDAGDEQKTIIALARIAAAAAAMPTVAVIGEGVSESNGFWRGFRAHSPTAVSCALR